MVAKGERGYALVAAVMAVTVFAYVAFQVLAAEQGDVAILSAGVEHAKLSAAAEGGINLAIHGLAEDDRGLRWPADGRPREIEFGDVSLTIVVEDDRGKAPLSELTDAQARALFQGAGAGGDQLDALVDEFRDWRNETVAVADEASPPEHAVRHGPIATVGELTGLRDMNAKILARIAPAVTVFGLEDSPFTPSDASPLAVAAMSGQAMDNPQTLANAAAAASEKPDQAIADDDLVGHTLTVRVTAKARDGAKTGRMAVVELTGDKVQPYWIRYVE